MGYYTKFELQGVEPRHEYDTIAKAICNKSAYGENTLDENCDPIKWYDAHKDCLAVSADHPTIGFRLSGQGENPGDVWWKEYYGGALVHAWKQEVSPLAGVSPKLQLLVQSNS
jgi:hypothetical protein